MNALQRLTKLERDFNVLLPAPLSSFQPTFAVLSFHNTPGKRKAPYRDVFRKKEEKRTLKIKKHKGRSQEHIGEELVF